MRVKHLLLSLIFGLLAGAAQADCRKLTFDDRDYTACAVAPGEAAIELFLNDNDGTLLGGFSRLEAMLTRRGQQLLVAMNGGMYHDDRRPVGLFQANGKQEQRLITADGPGNFGLLPNGVICVNGADVRVIESTAFKAQNPDCTFATQSGPMLVIDGALHPRFLPNSKSRNIRNGVGVTADGTTWLVISDQPVTFWEFARLFQIELKTPNALYLDGKISRLFAPELGRADGGLPMGPILGVIAPQR